MENDEAASRARRDELAKELLPPLPKMAQMPTRSGAEMPAGGVPRQWRGFVLEEWGLLERFPLLVGVCVSIVDDSGHRGTEKEENAIDQAYADASQRYPGNPIIQSVLGMARQGPPLAERARQLITQQSPDALRAEMAREAPQVVALLRRAPSAQVSDEYKQFVLAVGETVARAAKEGGFPRFASVEISEWERQTIQWVGEALRMEQQFGDWDALGIDTWQRDY